MMNKQEWDSWANPEFSKQDSGFEKGTELQVILPLSKTRLKRVGFLFEKKDSKLSLDPPQWWWPFVQLESTRTWCKRALYQRRGNGGCRGQLPPQFWTDRGKHFSCPPSLHDAILPFTEQKRSLTSFFLEMHSYKCTRMFQKAVIFSRGCLTYPRPMFSAYGARGPRHSPGIWSIPKSCLRPPPNFHILPAPLLHIESHNVHIRQGEMTTNTNKRLYSFSLSREAMFREDYEKTNFLGDLC